VVVQEAEQVRATVVDHRAVQRVGGSQLVAELRLEAVQPSFHGNPAAARWRWIVRSAGELPSASTMVRWICAALAAHAEAPMPAPARAPSGSRPAAAPAPARRTRAPDTPGSTGQACCATRAPSAGRAPDPSLVARDRTSAPRSRGESAGSTASPTSRQRNKPGRLPPAQTIHLAVTSTRWGRPGSRSV
jgi:hypothetical protein